MTPDDMRLANPFTPTFGKMPPFWAGREQVAADMEEAFLGVRGNPNRSTLLVGARGTGKTALLVRICETARSYGWACARVSCRKGMQQDIVERALEATRAPSAGASRSRARR